MKYSHTTSPPQEHRPAHERKHAHEHGHTHEPKYSPEVYGLFFGSLANPNRLRIINLLRNGKKNVTEICHATGFERTMISHNLTRLERCGMVFVEQKGKFRYYALNRETIKPLMDLIDAHMGQYCIHVLSGKR